MGRSVIFLLAVLAVAFFLMSWGERERASRGFNALDIGTSAVRNEPDDQPPGKAAVFSPGRRSFQENYLRQLKLPSGFQVNVFERELGNPRMMAVGEDGKVYVTRPETNDVIALEDTDRDGVSDWKTTVASGLKGVHGIALRQGKMYLATVREVLVAEMNGKTPGPFKTLVRDLPSGGRHPKRTLDIGPDGVLYVSIGSSCNACAEKNPEHATLLAFSPEGEHRRIFAKGLRNTIGFGWHPQTRQMWGLDIGTDWVGANVPPEELNLLDGGGDFGWPWCYGNRQVDPKMDPPKEMTSEAYCRRRTKPSTLTYQAHSSPIGMVFYTGSRFPEAYRGDAFIALRGSWNRKPAVGYKVARIDFENGRPVEIQDFMTGFLLPDGQSHFGRPAGVAMMRDGSLLVSDDTNGIIYRITYTGEAS